MRRMFYSFEIEGDRLVGFAGAMSLSILEEILHIMVQLDLPSWLVGCSSSSCALFEEAVSVVNGAAA
jgi:hypothetical protein